MEQNQNIDFEKINLMLNMVKNNNKNREENSIFKVETNNIKNILPFVVKEDNNMYKILDYIEINNIINTYKETNKNIGKEKSLQLKKEAILHIKKNVNEENKYIADIFIKAMEIREILNKRGI